MELRIDPEFEGKIPPLTAEEFQQLENNILADGVVINPIIVWDGVITKSLTVKAVRFTESAKEKIEKAGGKAEVI